MKIYINKSQYGYSTTCKDKENNKCYLDVQFKKGDEPEEEVKEIQIINAFFSCYKSKDGIKPKLIIMDYAPIPVKQDGQAVAPSQFETSKTDSNTIYSSNLLDESDPFGCVKEEVELDDENPDIAF